MMGNKHKHYDLIVAKAANMDLVQFIKMNGIWEDAGLSDKFISFSEEYDYFLCLPKHKEACLHWLNGGEVQVMDSSWVNMFPIENYPWEGEHDFMDDEASIRIKPKKEKRWIGVYGNHVTEAHFETLEKARSFINGCPSLYSKLVPDNWQFIEIEVEV
ncbi:hypothetical protein [Vibrio phage H188]|nr:hypothetical protein [Vibrio phage H188]